MPLNQPKPLVIAQMSDSHLFAEPDALHCGANVFKNFKQVLAKLSANSAIDYIVFTGDLTQDHTEQSYLNFANAVKEAGIQIPVLYLAGNHDEFDLFDKYLSAPPFISNKQINSATWQIQLINSKSKTPAGFVANEEQLRLKHAIDSSKHQLIMMHHHPVDVGYFIDRHGLQNKAEFWQAIQSFSNIKGIACGHVHSARLINKFTTTAQQNVDVYTCGATSIQFDPQASGVSALPQGPSYREFYLYDDGSINSKIIEL